jgi:hypothetical protein
MSGRLPTRSGIGSWCALLGVAVFLGGWMGGVGAVVVAVVVLADLPKRVIGVVGVASLVCVPLFVLLAGLPARSEVSPAFVNASLWPHRLAFVGLLLVGTWAILDLLPHLRREAEEAPPAPVPAPVPPTFLAVVLVLLVAAGAVAASLAVLQA